MNTYTTELLKEVKLITSNKFVMTFLESEAAEATASDIRAKTGSGTTAKAVAILLHSNSLVKDRFNEYLSAAILGAIHAKYNHSN